MSPRFKHESAANPVVALLEIMAFLDHGRTLEIRTIINHYPHRVSAGMRIDAFKGMFRHFANLIQVPDDQLAALTAQLQIPLAVVLAYGNGEDRARVNLPALSPRD